MATQTKTYEDTLCAEIALSTLNLAPYATADQARRAYRRLSLQYHPDHNPDPTATDTFIRITRAKEYLDKYHFSKDAESVSDTKTSDTNVHFYKNTEWARHWYRQYHNEQSEKKRQADAQEQAQPAADAEFAQAHRTANQYKTQATHTDPLDAAMADARRRLQILLDDERAAKAAHLQAQYHLVDVMAHSRSGIAYARELSAARHAVRTESHQYNAIKDSVRHLRQEIEQLREKQSKSRSRTYTPGVTIINETAQETPNHVSPVSNPAPKPDTKRDISDEKIRNFESDLKQARTTQTQKSAASVKQTTIDEKIRTARTAAFGNTNAEPAATRPQPQPKRTISDEEIRAFELEMKQAWGRGRPSKADQAAATAQRDAERQHKINAQNEHAAKQMAAYEQQVEEEIKTEQAQETLNNGKKKTDWNALYNYLAIFTSKKNMPDHVVQNATRLMKTITSIKWLNRMVAVGGGAVVLGAMTVGMSVMTQGLTMELGQIIGASSVVIFGGGTIYLSDVSNSKGKTVLNTVRAGIASQRITPPKQSLFGRLFGRSY